MISMLASTAALRSPRRTIRQQTIPVRRVSSHHLKLARYGLEANRGKVVSVTHFVKREGNLQWRGPNGEVVAQTHHTAASNETGGGAEPESFTIRGRLLRKHSPSSLSSYSAGCKATSISADRMRFSEIAILTCAPPTAAMGTRPWRWHSYTLEESSRAVLEAVTATANGLQEVIGGADAHMRWFSMSVSHPPRRDAVCAELTEEVYRLINEAYLPQKTAATRSAGYFYQNWLLQRVCSSHGPMQLSPFIRLLQMTYPTTQRTFMEKVQQLYRTIDDSTDGQASIIGIDEMTVKVSLLPKSSFNAHIGFTLTANFSYILTILVCIWKLN
ncbi:hypothetical protein EGR_10039 [Echinococcus granulosus]|uniref:Uncharacterized protein n=1 Tax=Echinococcus granulosus TaxID=6210 RepID=W6U9D9_ECHGR|nr:hypothetical protein EGR_10039 [Echinococcus granulosus]EUB55102.1 hypothetical protein EGR_10039 [Echinococcus granulosus]